MFSKLTESAMALLMNLVSTMQVAEVLPAVLLNRHGCCIPSMTAAGSLGRRLPRPAHSTPAARMWPRLL
jgi:hypothetical protein